MIYALPIFGNYWFAYILIIYNTQWHFIVVRLLHILVTKITHVQRKVMNNRHFTEGGHLTALCFQKDGKY